RPVSPPVQPKVSLPPAVDFQEVRSEVTKPWAVLGEKQDVCPIGPAVALFGLHRSQPQLRVSHLPWQCFRGLREQIPNRSGCSTLPRVGSAAQPSEKPHLLQVAPVVFFALRRF